MKCYKVKLPGYLLAFTYITTEPPESVPAAIFERFGAYPQEVIEL